MIKRLLMCMSAVMMLTAGMQDSYGDDVRLKYEDYEQLYKKLNKFLIWDRVQNVHGRDAMIFELGDAAIRIGYIKQLISENCRQAGVLKGIKVGDTIAMYYNRSICDRKIHVIGDDDAFPCAVNITDEEYQGQFKMFAGMLFDHFVKYDGKYHIPHDAFQQLTETLGDSDLAQKLQQIQPGNSIKLDAEFVID